MLLAVDAGNTHTVFGIFEGERLCGDWRVATRKDVTEDELAVSLQALLDRAGFQELVVDGMIVASVVPDVNQALDALGRRYFDHAPMFVGPGLKTGMPILYENPHEVGADRIVNAVAAKARFGAPVVVLDFGTATTFDVVGTEGEYLGGVIAPGVNVSAEALFERAARLHRVGVQRPQRVIGRHTEQSLESGLYHGYASMVEGLVRRIREEIGEEAPVVATGGLARTFEPELEFLAGIDLGLTLEGLRMIWEKNRK